MKTNAIDLRIISERGFCLEDRLILFGSLQLNTAEVQFYKVSAKQRLEIKSLYLHR